LRLLSPFGVNSFVQTMRNSFVQQIEPAKDAMRMEEVVKLFSTALAQPLLSLIMFGITARKATVGAITMALILMATDRRYAMRNR